MEDKYYTPEIEEFHVGFEYEIYGTYASNNIEGVWLPVVYEEDLVNLTDDSFTVNLSRFNYRIAKKTIRVKYLDREDIESLGFEYDGKSCLDETWEKEESIVDTWSYYVDTTEDKEKYYSLYSQGKLCYITYTAYQNSVGSTVDQIFKGTIKNKSELKKVLKMLNIN